jgi:sugar/nucleoside kinase (ribokinase family)
VTLGEQGSYYAAPGISRLVPAYKVHTVDATGCGDAFFAGLLYQLVQVGLQREDWRDEFLYDALRYANAVGALTALTQGVIPALPFKAQVDQFLQLPLNHYKTI